jgi:hypothetical protein
MSGSTPQPGAPASQAPLGRKLQILVLHGSRQDGAVFAQRLRTLVKKLKNIAVCVCIVCASVWLWGDAAGATTLLRTPGGLP